LGCIIFVLLAYTNDIFRQAYQVMVGGARVMKIQNKLGKKKKHDRSGGYGRDGCM
jgi:hypothetical protein